MHPSLANITAVLSDRPNAAGVGKAGHHPNLEDAHRQSATAFLRKLVAALGQLPPVGSGFIDYDGHEDGLPFCIESYSFHHEDGAFSIRAYLYDQSIPQAYRT